MTEPMPKLSLLTPTYNRQAYLPLLAEAMAAQTATDYEWLVLDDSPEPVQLSGKNLTYIHMEERLSVGKKRNILAEQASGDILIHIDDDDYYGPNYAANMAKSLIEEKADMLLLSGFLCSDLRYPAHGWYLPAIKQSVGFNFGKDGPIPLDLGKLKLPLIHLCFGFSYAYTKALWQLQNFPELNAFEDREFTRQALINHKIITREDRDIDVIHTVHGGSTSNCFPQYMIPEFMIERMLPDGFAHLQRLRELVKQGL